MTGIRIQQTLVALAVGALLALPAMPQEPIPSSRQAGTTAHMQDEAEQGAMPTRPPQPEKLTAGLTTMASGMIVRRDPDSFVLREDKGRDLLVKLTDSTQVREKKINPFRDARHYEATQLLRGLSLEVEGKADDSGALVARKIRFTASDYKVARNVDERVMVVEGRMGSAETRLAEGEQNAQRMSGQISELSAVANTARGGARAAQQSADQAQQAADHALAAIRATNGRISEIDDYTPARSATIHFKVNSAALSAEAKAQLDELAEQAKSDKGFVIQVQGFASSDGGKEYNRRLSARRAEAVVRYLAEDRDIPLRRIVIPFGYGDAKPVADNGTRQGRQENRRVELTILVSKGLTTSQDITSDPSTTSSNTGKNPQ